jgi:hypothetical protein
MVGITNRGRSNFLMCQFKKKQLFSLFFFQVSIAFSFSWRDGICRFLMALAKKTAFWLKLKAIQKA